MDKCDFKDCKEESSIGYYTKHLCSKHWQKLSELPVDELKKILNIKDKKIVMSPTQKAERPLIEHQ